MIRLLMLLPVAGASYLAASAAATSYARHFGWPDDPAMFDRQEKFTVDLLWWVVFVFVLIVLDHFVKQWLRPRGGGGVIIIGPAGFGEGPKPKGLFQQIFETLLAVAIGAVVLIWLSHLTGYR